MSNDALRARYASVLERVAEAVAAAGRRPEEVRLVAVSKLHPAGDVAEVAAAGQVDFGETMCRKRWKSVLCYRRRGCAATCAGI